MELPVKLGYSAQFHAEVAGTLYAWYGIAGGAVQVAATLTVGRVGRSRQVLSRQAPCRGIRRSALHFAASVALPCRAVNSTWAEIPRTSPAEFAAAYARLRPRWEFGHLAAFIAWLTGWLGLVAVTTRGSCSPVCACSCCPMPTGGEARHHNKLEVEP
jgi:hypothetical protein